MGREEDRVDGLAEANGGGMNAFEMPYWVARADGTSPADTDLRDLLDEIAQARAEGRSARQKEIRATNLSNMIAVRNARRMGVKQAIPRFRRY